MLRVHTASVTHRHGGPESVWFSLDRFQHVGGRAFHPVRRRGQDRCRDRGGLLHSQVESSERGPEFVEHVGGHTRRISFVRLACRRCGFGGEFTVIRSMVARYVRC